jgi:hypothetical protein
MKGLRWSLILFQFFWLNIVLPGHTRGMITVPGTPPAGSVSDDCCATHSDSKQPTPDQQKHCAICNFAIGLFTPPVVNYDHLIRGLLHTLPIPPPAAVESDSPLLTYHGRAPPLV